MEKREKSRLDDPDKPRGVFYQGHIPMTKEDALIFRQAIVEYQHPNISKAIDAAGGHMGHKYSFSAIYCDNKPILPWAESHEPEFILAALNEYSEILEGIHS